MKFLAAIVVFKFLALSVPYLVTCCKNQAGNTTVQIPLVFISETDLPSLRTGNEGKLDENIFQLIPRSFLVPNGESLIIGSWNEIKQFLFSTAKYNKKYQNQTDFHPAEVWVALNVGITPNDDILKIKTIAKQTNNIFPETCKLKLMVSNNLLTSYDTKEDILHKIRSYKRLFSNNIQILQQITMQEIEKASLNCTKQINIHEFEEAKLMVYIFDDKGNDTDIFWKCRQSLANFWKNSNVIIKTNFQIDNATTDTKCLLMNNSDSEYLRSIYGVSHSQKNADVVTDYNNDKEESETATSYTCDSNHTFSKTAIKRIPYLSITEGELLRVLVGRKGLKTTQHFLCNVPRLFILPEAITYPFDLWGLILIILTDAAIFNKQNHNQSNFVSAKIWIGVWVNVVDADDLTELYNITVNTNAVYPNTCSIKLLRTDKFKSQSVTDDDTATAIQSYAEVFPQFPQTIYLTNMQEIESISVNCTMPLKLDAVENSFFMIPIYNDKYNDTGMFWKCRHVMSSIMDLPNVVIKTNAEIHDTLTDTKFLFSNHSDSQYLVGINHILEQYENADVMILYEEKSTEKVDDNKPKSCASSYTLKDSLQLDDDFQKAGVGFSLHFDSLVYNTAQLIPTLIQTSPKFIIENAFNLTQHSYDQIENTLDNILAAFSNYSDENNIVNGKNVRNNVSKACSLKVSVKLNFYVEQHISNYLYWVTTAMKIAQRKNEIFNASVVVTNVVISLHAVNWNTTSMTFYNNIFKQLKHLDLLNSTGVKLGIVKFNCTVEESLPGFVSQVYYVHYTLPYDGNGNPSCYRDYQKRFYEKLAQCQWSMDSARNQGVENILYVNVLGYTSDNNVDNRLVSYAKILSALLEVVSHREEMMYLYPAFEPEPNFNNEPEYDATICDFKQFEVWHENKHNERCFRGWWLVFKDNSSSQFWAEDKKAVVLQQYHNETISGKFSFKQKSIFRNRFQLTRDTKCFRPNSNSTIKHISVLWIILPAAILLVAATVVITYVTLRLRARHFLGAKDLQEFFKGTKGITSQRLVGSGVALSKKYNKRKYEVSASKYTIDDSKCLGSGVTGTVFTGIIGKCNETIRVAVKMTRMRRGNADSSQLVALKGLISEIKILAYIGNHQNIVRLIGAHTGKLQSGYLLAFLELCELGSLQQYLRKEDPNTQKPDMEDVNTPVIPDHQLFEDFKIWSEQIVEGMAYLVSKHIVHADLAARNILLTSEKIAKISDFGLSRRIYNYTQYFTNREEPLPWRWMAPEALKKMILNEKTDVWAFGILLWEMYSLGDTPYPGLSWDVNFPIMLEAGLKPAAPKYEKDNMYAVMLRCWSNRPEKRPTFLDLKKLLQTTSSLSEQVSCI